MFVRPKNVRRQNDLGADEIPSMARPQGADQDLHLQLHQRDVVSGAESSESYHASVSDHLRERSESASVLNARNACPVCPAGAVFAKSGPRQRCCMKRKVATRVKFVTSTRTRIIRITKTRTSAKARTTTRAPVLVQGRIFIDINGNSAYDSGVDVPFADTAFLILKVAALQKRAGSAQIGEFTTDAGGAFSTMVDAEVGDLIGIATAAEPGKMLFTGTIPPGPGGVVINIDVPPTTSVSKEWEMREAPWRDAHDFLAH